MGHDEALLERLRAVLAESSDVVEKQMVGGRSFSRSGRMFCGVAGDGLMVRVGRDGVAAALEQPQVRRMTLGGRTLAAFVIVDPAGVETDAALRAWVQRGLREVSS
jgi:TfoX N-terminal domain